MSLGFTNRVIAFSSLVCFGLGISPAHAIDHTIHTIDADCDPNSALFDGCRPGNGTPNSNRPTVSTPLKPPNKLDPSNGDRTYTRGNFGNRGTTGGSNGRDTYNNGNPNTNGNSSLVVEAPCDKQGFRSCSDFLNGETTAPTASQRQPYPGILELLQKRVQQQIDGYYGQAPNFQGQNVDLNQSILPDGSTDVSATRPIGPTICSLEKTPYTRKKQVGGVLVDYSEQDLDHVSRSCGKPVNIEVWRNGRTVYSRITKNDPMGVFGSLESGYIRGAIVPGVSCFTSQVLSELATSKGLTLNPILGSSSPCYAFAKDFVSINTQFNTAYASTVADLKSGIDATSSRLLAQANSQDIINCEADWDALGVDQGRLRQSAQKLCAARAGIETAFTQLAACEIFARGALHFQDRFGNAERQRAIYQTIISQVFSKCQNDCRNTVSSNPSDAELTSCANSCYKAALPDYMANLIEQEWGNPQTGCNRTGNAILADPAADANQKLADTEQRLQSLLAENTRSCSADSECVVGNVGGVCSDGKTSEGYVLYADNKANFSTAKEIAQAIADYNLFAAGSDFLSGRSPSCTSNPAPTAKCAAATDTSSGGYCEFRSAP